MEHVGIDLGARKSHVVVLDAKGRENARAILETAKLPDWLSQRSPSRLVIEACTQSPTISKLSRDAGHQTFVVPGHMVRMLGVGFRGIKTDFRDAEALAHSSYRVDDLPSAHLRSDPATERQRLLHSRELLLKSRRAAALSIKTWFRGQLINLRGRANSKAFSEKVRELMAADPDGMSLWMDAMLDSFDALTVQIDRLTAEVERFAEQDQVAQLLQSAPGVGPVLAMSFTAHIDDPSRFKSADELASYLALVPRESTTGGGAANRLGIITAGPKRLKALLVQSAWTIYRTKPNEPLGVWVRHLEQRRGKQIAIVGLARKLATIMWSMWKHGDKYDPTRAAERIKPAS